MITQALRQNNELINGLLGQLQTGNRPQQNGSGSTSGMRAILTNQQILGQILEISRRMAEIRQIEPLLDYVVDRALELVGAERGCIVLSQAAGPPQIKASRSRGGKSLKEQADHISQSVFEAVIKVGQPLILEDALSDPRFDGAQSVINLKLRSIMCAPLIVRGQTIGALYVENRSCRFHFTEDDLTPVILLANQAAIAIENAALNDDLETRVAARTQELEKSRAQTEQTKQMHMRWFNETVHDLRAPLGVAITALSLLQQGDMGDVNDTQHEWIGKSLASVQYSIDLIDNLFYLFRLEAGGFSLRRRPVSLQAFLHEVYEVGLGLAWPRQITFELDIPTPLPQVSMDPIRIRQVILNLLANAQKFANEGTVTLYTERREDEILIGVKDTGDGIPPDQLDQLFRRYQQVDVGSERWQLGVGLGLTICSKLVELHGGRIWAESRPGKGSNFMFTLPLEPVASS